MTSCSKMMSCISLATWNHMSTHLSTHPSIHLKRFIIKSWLAQLWRLTGPKICSLQARNPRELIVCVPMQRSADLGSQKSRCFSSSLKAGKNNVPVWSSKTGGIATCSGEGQSLFDPDLQLIGGPSTLGRTIYLTPSVNSIIKLIQNHPSRDIRITFYQISEHRMSLSSWHTNYNINQTIYT